MTPFAKSILIFALMLLISASTAWAAQSIQNSPHNLSSSGPGGVQAISQQEICIFCHTPHKSQGMQPLWNRNIPNGPYTIYASPTLIAKPGTPTGSSKLCLSCHDGTIALGQVLSQTTPIAMQNNVTTIPIQANLGTDLSGSHPISFTYDPTHNPSLAPISSLPQSIRMGRSAQLECRACHNPHDNTNGNFLVMDNSQSQLCQACHVTLSHTTDVSGHSGCADCHQEHQSPSGPYLLRADNESDTCLLCHSGTIPSQAVVSTSPGSAGVGSLSPNQASPARVVAPQKLAASANLPTFPDDRAGANVAPDMVKVSIHDTRSPVKRVRGDTRVTNCADCHEPHTMKTAQAAAPNIPGSFGHVSGIDANGAKVRVARFEYEVCFRCHNDRHVVKPTITRQLAQPSLRQQMETNAISFHPVVGPGRNQDVPSLRRKYTTGSQIYCSDCHNSDSGRKAGGIGPNGTHGSDFEPLLVERYDMKDGSPETQSAYALCYRCHDRISILSNQSFSRHKIHIVDAKTPCSICHDAHGISSVQGMPARNAHLINFDTSVVRPDPKTKRLEYQSLGNRAGVCYLTCHGKVHSGTSYP